MEIVLKMLKSIVVASIIMGSSTDAAAYKGPTTIAALNLIKEFECFRSNFYTDSAGAKTIGYGYACSANPCDKLRPPISEVQATNLLKTQIKSFENCVNQNVKNDQLNACQFSALVSFALNMGCGSLKGSMLVNKLNRCDVAGAAAEFAKWNKVGGKVLPELTKRRAAERELFCSNKVC